MAKPVVYFWKKLHRRCFTGLKYASDRHDEQFQPARMLYVKMNLSKHVLYLKKHYFFHQDLLKESIA